VLPLLVPAMAGLVVFWTWAWLQGPPLEADPLALGKLGPSAAASGAAAVRCPRVPSCPHACGSHRRSGECEHQQQLVHLLGPLRSFRGDRKPRFRYQQRSVLLEAWPAEPRLLGGRRGQASAYREPIASSPLDVLTAPMSLWAARESATGVAGVAIANLCSWSDSWLPSARVASAAGWCGQRASRERSVRAGEERT
jgi:hypothetical protein